MKTGRYDLSNTSIGWIFTVIFAVAVIGLVYGSTNNVERIAGDSGITHYEHQYGDTRNYTMPSARNVTLYLHNTTSPTGDLGEYQILNTTIPQTGSTLVSKKVLNEDWALNPPLASDVVFNGNGSVALWLSANPGPNTPPTLYIEIDEIDGSGNTLQTLVPQTSPSYIVSLTATPQLVWFNFSVPQSTVHQGNYIRLYIYLDGDASTDYGVHWGPTYRSFVNITFEAPIDVQEAFTLNYQMEPQAGFAATAANKTIYVKANVSNVLGGYDIRSVNITIRGSDGTEVVSNASMTLVDGYYNTYINTYLYEWNYTGQQSGFYNVTVYAVDNTGYYYRYEYGHPLDVTYGGRLVWKNTSFSIGKNYYMNLQLVDSIGSPLENATVYTTDVGYTVSNTTNVSGCTNISLPGGTVNLKAKWNGVVVLDTYLVVTGNVTYANRTVIVTDVYYPTLKVTDNMGQPLDNASVFITYPNGATTTMPFKTNASGQYYLGRVPGGIYQLAVTWMGVEVNVADILIDTNDIYVLNTTVYHVTVYVEDSAGGAMPGAQVVFSDSGSGMVYSSEISDLTGKTVSIIPGGTYDISIYWRGLAVYLNSGYIVDGNNTIYASCNVYSVTITVVDVRNAPVSSAQVVISAQDGGVLDSTTTDIDGNITVTLPAGTHRVTIYWWDTVVYNSSLAISDGSPQVIVADVYYLNITALDGHPSSPLPLPSAEVTVSYNGEIKSRMLTGQDGWCETRLPGGNYDINIYWHGVPVYNSTHLLDSAGQDLTAMCAVYYITITVLDSQGTGVENATVSIMVAASNSLMESAITDRNGMATLRLPVYEYNIAAYWHGIEVARRNGYHFGGNSELVLNANVYYLDICVMDTRGVRVSDAQIVVERDSGDTITTASTDNNGNATVRIPLTTVSITTRWSGYIVNQTLLALSPEIVQDGLTINASIYYLTVELLDDSSIPVEGATITAEDVSGLYIRTISSDSRGMGVMRVPASQLDISVSWLGVNVAEVTGYSVGSVVDPVLSIDCSIHYLTINASDSHGIPVIGAPTYIYLNSTHHLMFSEMTDTSGHTVARLPASAYDIVILWNGVEVYKQTDYSLTSSTDIDAACSIFYVVFSLVDSQGYPVADATVTAYLSDGGLLSTGGTDSSGNITFRLPQSHIDLSVVWKGILVNESFDVLVSGDGHITVECSIYYLTVTAVDSLGSEALPYAHVSAHPWGSAAVIDSAQCDINGAVVLRLPGADYLLDVTWYDIPVRADFAVNLTSDDSLTVLCHVYYLTLNVNDMAGSPLSDGSVEIRYSDTGVTVASGITGEDGTITVRIPGGEYDIQIFWLAMSVYEESGNHIQESTTLSISASVYYLTIHASDSAEKPLENARVYVYSDITGNLLCMNTTDNAGVSVLRVPTGSLDVDIYWMDRNVFSTTTTVSGSDAVVDASYVCSVHYPEFVVKDDSGVPVESARIIVSSGGFIFATLLTDSNGSAVARLPAGEYDIDVKWKHVTVYTAAATPISSSSALEMNASVYYVTFHCLDDHSIHVESASVKVTHVLTGVVIATGSTNKDGQIVMRLPAGNYELLVKWLGVGVFSISDINLNSTDTVELDCQIYYLDVVVKQGDGAPLSSAYVSAISPDGKLVVYDTTDNNGRAVFRLPAGLYTVKVYYHGTVLMSSVDVHKEDTVSLQGSQEMKFTMDDVPPPVYTTNTFYITLGVLVILLAMIGAVYFMIGKKPIEPEAAEEIEREEEEKEDAKEDEEDVEDEEEEDVGYSEEISGDEDGIIEDEEDLVP